MPTSDVFFLRFYKTDSLKYQFRTDRSNTEHGVIAPHGHGLELVHAWLRVCYWSLSYVLPHVFPLFLSLSPLLSVLCCLDDADFEWSAQRSWLHRRSQDCSESPHRITRLRLEATVFLETAY